MLCNPADTASRGCKPTDLTSDTRWWKHTEDYLKRKTIENHVRCFFIGRHVLSQ